MKKLLGVLALVLAALIGPTHAQLNPGNSLVVGTVTLTGGATNGLLYNNAGVLGNLATGNSGVLITSGAGVPSISTTLPTGLAATSLALTNPIITGQQTTNLTAAASAALDQTAATAATFLAFASTTGMVAGQQVSGTNIPAGDQVASIVSTAQVTLTANGISASGQKVLTTTATTGSAVGQLCVDTTTPTAIGTGNTIASIQAGTSITMTINLAASTANSDSIVCDPTVTLTNATTSAPTGTISFYANATTLSASSAVVNDGDMSNYGNLVEGGAITVVGSALPTQASGTLGIGGIAAKPTMSANGEGDIYLTGSTGGLTFIGKGSTTDYSFLNSAGSQIAYLSTGSVIFDFQTLGIFGAALPLPAAATMGISGEASVPTMSANGEAALFITSTTGGISLMGKGSTNDFTVYNSSGSPVVTVPTGTASPAFPGVTTGTNADFACLAAGGVMTLQTSACTISSLRFKPDWKRYRGNVMEAIDRFDVGTFHIAGQEHNPDKANASRMQIGLNAENVAAIEPRCAIYEADGTTPKSYRQECVIAMLVAAVKTQQHEIDALKARRR